MPVISTLLFFICVRCRVQKLTQIEKRCGTAMRAQGARGASDNIFALRCQLTESGPRLYALNWFELRDARFLTARNLLRHPTDSGVPISNFGQRPSARSTLPVGPCAPF